MTVAVDETGYTSVSLTLSALHFWDEALDALAEVRETFTGDDQILWDMGISRYLKARYEEIIVQRYNGDADAASAAMDLWLSDYDVKATVARAAAIDESPLMMEAVAYAMALSASTDSYRPWVAFETVVDCLYRQLPATVNA